LTISAVTQTKASQQTTASSLKMFFTTLLLSLASLAVAAPQGGIIDPIILEGNATQFTSSGTPACGPRYANLPSGAFLAGLSQAYFNHFQPVGDSNPNDNTACGKHITVLYNGKSVTAEIVNTGGGPGLFDIILSTPAFQALTGQTSGTVPVGWEQVDF